MNSLIKLFLVLKLVLVSLQHEVKFPKDLDVNVQFPPISHDKLSGHLRPLGWQKRADEEVTEESVVIKPEEFWDQYITKKSPVVIRGLVSASPITDIWTDSYLKREYGNLDIKVTRKKNSNDMDSHQIKFKDFLEKYRHDDLFLKVIMPEIMQKDAPIPNILNCGPFVSSGAKIAQLTEPFIWMSVGETSSLIHADPDHELHCVLDGRTDFILIPKKQFKDNKSWRSDLGLEESFLNSGEWVSKINVDMVNTYEYEILQKTNWHWTTLKPGDCIYIPADYLRQFRSYGRSISTSIYFSQMKQLNESKMPEIKSKEFSKCPTNPPAFESMITYKNSFFWAYTHGERHIKGRNLQLSDTRNILIYLMRDDEVLFFSRFDNFFKEITKEVIVSDLADGDILKEKSDKIWNDFFLPQKPPCESFLTIERVHSLVSENLNRFTIIVNEMASAHDRKGSQEL